MTEDNTDIEVEELKKICTSSKSATFISEGITLEAKFGRIEFDFSDLQGYSRLDLVFKRVSGNGKVSIEAGTTQSVIIGSKVCQLVSFEHKFSLMKIIRPEGSIGEVVLMGATLHKDVDLLKQEEELMKNWQKLFTPHNTSCIRLVSKRLLVSEGGWIKDARVTGITTAPPGMSYVEGETIRFRGKCEITSINVDESIDTSPRISYLPHINSSIFQAGHVIKNVNNPLNIEVSNQIKDKLSYSKILYDSTWHQEFNPIKHRENDDYKTVNSNGKMYLITKSEKPFKIPATFLVTGKRYVLSVKAKKINGNGKVKMGIITSNSLSGSDKVETSCLMVIDGDFKEYFVEVSPTSLDLHNFLYISLDSGGVGEVLVESIKVLDFNVPTNRSLSRNVVHEEFKLKASDKKFVIVIPSYKNSEWCQKNIESCLNQKYPQFRIIYTNDCSPDDTYEKVKAVVDNHPNGSKCTLIKNEVRVGAMENLYNMIMTCDDEEIIVTVDGDDWLAHDHVLNILNDNYRDGKTWMTYGQYQNFPDKGIGICRQIPEHIMAGNAFRSYAWCSSHLRTFYTWLFKCIEREDHLYEGKFMPSSWDGSMQFPMLEMSGTEHSKFISDIMYIYNLENPINDHKVDKSLQQMLDHFIRCKPRYTALPGPVIKKTRNVKNIGLMIIATNKYKKFVQPLIHSADQYFLLGLNVTYYVFSDGAIPLESTRNVKQIDIPHRPFPYASMDRFRHFSNASSVLDSEDQLYYVDADCLFVNQVELSEIGGDMVGVRHCGYVHGVDIPVEKNSDSKFYKDINSYTHYFGGGFSGGRKEKYLAMSKELAGMIDQDVNNGIVPVWHDETALNWYYAQNPPETVLSPSYHYPEGERDLARYKRIWGGMDFERKILLLEKDHEEVRK